MVPIRRLDPVGAIGNYWADMRVPTDHELDLLQALADSTAVAIENVQVYEQLDAARTETLQCLARAAEYRDGATYEHTERVADLAARIAAELGWDAERVELLRLAAPLHDIGKLAVSDAVLLKAGKLTHDEFEQVKAHAEAGASILSGAQLRRAPHGTRDRPRAPRVVGRQRLPARAERLGDPRRPAGSSRSPTCTTP